MSTTAGSDVRRAPATKAHAIVLAATIRQKDAEEVVSSTGMHPLPVIVGAVEMSEVAWSVWFDGELGAIYGVVDGPEDALRGRTGCAWMLTSYAVERYKKTFWRKCYEWIPELFERWDVLGNSIDVRHEQAIRWAGRLGFQLQAPAPFGFEGLPFQRFTVRAEDLTRG